MLFGDLLSRFDDPAFAAEAVFQIGDVGLLADMRERAAAEGEGLGEFAQNAVRRFAAEASDEDWVTLLGALARASDPGAVCLRFAFRHATRS